MRIVIFRHGPAGRRDPSRWSDDGKRPLTTRGEARTRAAARGLRRLVEGRVSRVLSSPLLRAAQTARLAAEALDCGELQELETLSPGTPPGRALRSIAAVAGDDTIVVVGHEPDLSRLAGTMMAGGLGQIVLKKAGACAIDFEGGAEAGRGTLAWLLSPRVLRRLGRRHES